ncbi:sugar ABC transporter substrate-binding protein [uncultured Clostridium sp.]|uniref:sugar ABC transporter substrate-binding protein n=1 Tax=uncultured Clostridium sp. TaxID=59620 RepID=UPI0025D64613|nr:sugar ABC transporter substrate-binding protein [uncultured Clostridium sp.]
MKKKLMKRLSLMAAGIITIISFAGCGGIDAGAGNTNEYGQVKDEVKYYTYDDVAEIDKSKDYSDLKIGISMGTLNKDTFSEFGSKTAKKRIEEYGAQCVLTDANYDIATQIANIEDLIQQGCNLIMVNPVDGDALISAYEECKDAGIPVVFWFQPVTENNKDLVTFVCGGDEALIAENAFKSLKEAMGEGEKKIAFLSATVGYTMSDVREEKIKELVEADPSIDFISDIQYTDWVRETAQDKMESLLSKYGDEIGGVIAINDNTALGAYDALKTYGLQDSIPVVSNNMYAEGYKSISEGKLYSSNTEDIILETEFCIDNCMKYLKGEDVSYYNYDKTINCNQNNYKDVESPIY